MLLTDLQLGWLDEVAGRKHGSDEVVWTNVIPMGDKVVLRDVIIFLPKAIGDVTRPDPCAWNMLLSRR